MALLLTQGCGSSSPPAASGRGGGGGQAGHAGNGAGGAAAVGGGARGGGAGGGGSGGGVSGGHGGSANGGQATGGAGGNSATAGNGGNSATAGNGGNSATAGNGGNSATAGNGGNSATAGNGGNSATAGNGGNSATAGAGGNSATGGAGGNSATAGNGGGGGSMGGGPGGAAGTAAGGHGGAGGASGAAGGPLGGSAGGGAGGAVCQAGFGQCGGPTCDTNLMTSATNCGMCGRDCTVAGASCSSGLCTAGPLYGTADLPFGTDNSGARSVVFDAASASIYWAGFNAYSVRRYPLDGSGAKLVWQPTTTATAGTESLAVTGGNVYWSVGGSPAAVLTKPVNADATVAPTVAFNPDARASFLRVQGDWFYWATGDYQDPSGPAKGQVYRRLIAAASSDPGTAIVTVDQGNFGDFKALDVTTDAVYWVSDAGQGTPYELRTVPLAGGTPAAVPKIAGATDTAITQSPGAAVLAAQGNTIYLARTITATPSLNGIYRYAPGDAAPTLVVSADGVTSMIVDADTVYFLRQNVNDVFQAPLAGGTAEPIAFASGYKLVAEDATTLYLLQSGCCQSSLLKILK